MNDIVQKTDWNDKRQFLFCSKDLKYEKLWLGQGFGRFLNNKRVDTVFRFNKEAWQLNRTIERFGRHDYITNEIEKILNDIKKKKSSFYKKHIIIKRILYYKEEKFYIVGFSQQMYSYILQKYEIDEMVADYLSFMFSDTEENKNRKKKELKDLYDKVTSEVFLND